ncbi:MAG: NADH:flavin oxidoreductase [Planctomycetota bacterium]|jgi:2,4-dienoyl-CoA reductase-like NADH-dependent reductase (Old Yellow Enzyme family)
MSRIFERSVIGDMELANRFVRSATWEGMATEGGAVTPKLIETIAALAEGGVGLIISSHAYVSAEGQASPWQVGIDRDEMIPGLSELTTAVHQSGGRIVAQLAHAGNFAAEKLTRQPPLVVSDYEGLADSPRKEMTVEDIRKLIDAFAAAAGRAKSAGFDGVQIHSAHGYLLSQFLSPIYNRRRDEYGGDAGNRARIHLEICDAVRQQVGRDYPVLIKMNCRDFAENGLTLEDSVRVAELLAGAGFDAIELSGGLLTNKELSPCRSGINSPDKEAYFKQEARVFKQKLDIPLILVGGVRSIEVAEQLVEGGTTDYISMSRPFIREPDIVNRWKAGDRARSSCKSDNLCFRPGLKGEGIYCVPKMRAIKSECKD